MSIEYLDYLFEAWNNSNHPYWDDLQEYPQDWELFVTPPSDEELELMDRNAQELLLDLEML